MIRYELLKSILPIIRGHLVVCNIGAPSQELYALDDQETNFYMLGTMGLCSSIGFGLALAQEKTVIAIDGDGSVLTNLATLSTIGNHQADNFILLIVDNGSYGSTGDQPTYTSGRTSLAKVAAACGCENTASVPAENVGEVLREAIAMRRQSVIIAECQSGNVDVPVIDLDPVNIIERFKTQIQDI